MDDDQIYERGGTEEDVRKYAEEHGATDPRSDLEIIRAACVKAIVPKLTDEQVPFAAEMFRPIRLADVLLAIKDLYYGVELAFNGKDFLAIGYDNHANENSFTEWCEWNLLKDDVSLQSEPCKAFLAGLLKGGEIL